MPLTCQAPVGRSAPITPDSPTQLPASVPIKGRDPASCEHGNVVRLGSRKIGALENKIGK